MLDCRIGAYVAKVLGALIILLSTCLALGLDGGFGYLILTASASAILFIFTGLKPVLLGSNFANSPPVPVLIAAGGVVFGVEGVMLLAVYSELTHAYYALAALAGSFVVLLGNYNATRVRMQFSGGGLGGQLLTASGNLSLQAKKCSKQLETRCHTG